MKKLLLLFTIVLFASCSSDDDFNINKEVTLYGDYRFQTSGGGKKIYNQFSFDVKNSLDDYIVTVHVEFTLKNNDTIYKTNELFMEQKGTYTTSRSLQRSYEMNKSDLDTYKLVIDSYSKK